MTHTLRRLKIFWNFIFQLKMAKTESWMLLTNWLQVRKKRSEYMLNITQKISKNVFADFK